MEEINKLFYGDEVSFKCPTSYVLKTGLVLKETEWEVKDNSKTVEVIWFPDGNKEFISANKVDLVNRSFKAGSTVSKYRDGKPVGQLGYCENVDVYANIQISSTNKMIPNVCTDDFNHTTAFEVGSTVVFNMWVGEIFDVIQTIMFASEDGSIFSLEDPFKEDFISLTMSPNFSMDDSVFQRFHVGQQLKMCLDALKNATFFDKSNAMQNILHKYQNTECSKWVKVYAQHVEVSSVEVKWCPQQSPATYALETNMPPKIFTKDNLEKLEILSSREIHLGDTYSYTIKDHDHIADIENWQRLYSEICNNNSYELPQYYLQKQKVYNEFGDEEIAAIKLQKHNQKREKKYALKSISKPAVPVSINDVRPSTRTNKTRLRPFARKVFENTQCYRAPKLAMDLNTNVSVEVINTKTAVDVVWADGTRDAGIAAIMLCAIQDDTYSLKYKPGVFVLPEKTTSSVYGVIESAHNVERTSRIRVQWFNMEGCSRRVATIPKIMDESIQKLRYHPMYNLKFGTLVIAFEEVPVPSKTFTIGKVIGAGKDGKISVSWSNGKMGKHWPQKLLVIKNGFTYQHIFRDNLLHSEWLISKPNCSRAMTTMEEIEKSLLDLLKLGNDGIRTLTKCIYFTVPSVDLLDELEEAIELVMKGFYVIPFFACETFQSELEKIYKSIIQLVIQTIETAYQRFYGEKQEIDEYKDLIDSLFLRLTGKISDYTNKIEEILVNYMSVNQKT